LEACLPGTVKRQTGDASLPLRDEFLCRRTVFNHIHAYAAGMGAMLQVPAAAAADATGGQLLQIFFNFYKLLHPVNNTTAFAVPLVALLFYAGIGKAKPLFGGAAFFSGIYKSLVNGYGVGQNIHHAFAVYNTQQGGTLHGDGTGAQNFLRWHNIT
jgi:hypothetical protein